MSELIGKRYQIVKLLGSGGMADVYLAFDTILKREVAVKILKSDMSEDEIALERFKREAGAATKLSHPNIVDVYDVGDDGSKHYIVMEYVKGHTLKQLIKKRGPIPYKEAVWMMKQLAGALMEAHRNNVIHRDVKSQNVLIKDDGTIKLSDFGIALASGFIQITHQDSVLGSVHYLAPEVSKGKQASMQSDIYSLGIVFYELLTGDVPFKGDNPIEVALKHIKGTIPSVRSINPEIPQAVEDIIRKATAKSLNERYKNIALMLQDLNECLKKPAVTEKEEVPAKKKHLTRRSDKGKEPGSGKSIFSVMFLVLVSILSILILVMVLYFSGIIGNRNRMVTVPILKNLTVQEAKDILAVNRLEVDDSRITWILSDDVEKDRIISSYPEEGDEVEIGTRIKLTVSSGIYSVLKDYVGKDYREAQKELNELNFKVRLLPVDSKENSGTVISQSLEPGTKFDSSQNNEITLKYAQEISIILPYELKGKNIDEVIEYFHNNNINYVKSPQEKDYFTEEEILDSPPYTLIRTEPELGSTYTRTENEEVKIYYYE